MIPDVEIKDYNSFDHFVADVYLKWVCAKEDQLAVSVIANGSIMGDLIKRIILTSYSTECSVQSIHFDAAFDNREYILTLVDNELWCEPAWREDVEYDAQHFKFCESDTIYLHEDCIYQILNYIAAPNVYIFGIQTTDQLR